MPAHPAPTPHHDALAALSEASKRSRLPAAWRTLPDPRPLLAPVVRETMAHVRRRPTDPRPTVYNVRYALVADLHRPNRVLYLRVQWAAPVLRKAERLRWHALDEAAQAAIAHDLDLDTQHTAPLAALQHRRELRFEGLRLLCRECDGEGTRPGPVRADWKRRAHWSDPPMPVQDDVPCDACEGRGFFPEHEPVCGECGALFSPETLGCLGCAVDLPWRLLCAPCAREPETHEEHCAVAARMREAA